MGGGDSRKYQDLTLNTQTLKPFSQFKPPIEDPFIDSNVAFTKQQQPAGGLSHFSRVELNNEGSMNSAMTKNN